MRHIFITASKKNFFKKGDRLLIKMGKVAFLATISQILNLGGINRIDVLYDDGYMGNISPDSENILGFGISKKVKKAIDLKDVQKYFDPNRTLERTLSKDSKKVIRGYHFTNMEAYKKMMKEGKIGISAEQMVEELEEFLRSLNVPQEKIDHFIKENYKDLAWDRDGVSFWRNISKKEWKSSLNGYSKTLADDWGESYGHSFEMALKFAARVLKIKYPILKLSKLPKFDSTPVCIVVDLPINLVEEGNKVAKGIGPNEVRSKGNISTKYIVDVWK